MANGFVRPIGGGEGQLRGRRSERRFFSLLTKVLRAGSVGPVLLVADAGWRGEAGAVSRHGGKFRDYLGAAGVQCPELFDLLCLVHAAEVLALGS